jgi:hypothetical protein
MIKIIPGVEFMGKSNNFSWKNVLKISTIVIYIGILLMIVGTIALYIII